MPNTHATLSALFTDIASAIREKSGTSETIIADNFPSAIQDIPTGGSGEKIDLPNLGTGISGVELTNSRYNLISPGMFANKLTFRIINGSPTEQSPSVVFSSIDSSYTYPFSGSINLTNFINNNTNNLSYGSFYVQGNYKVNNSYVANFNNPTNWVSLVSLFAPGYYISNKTCFLTSYITLSYTENPIVSTASVATMVPISS